MSVTLKDLEDRLSEILGDDLAESLIKAALRPGEITLDLQLAMNDGLETLTREQRLSTLSALDTLKAALLQQKAKA